MKYRIISVGKLRESFYVQGINEYLQRLRPYTSMELVDGLEEKVHPRAGDKDIARVLQKEGDKILNLVGKEELLVALDSHGEPLGSEELSQQINTWNLSGSPRVNLVVGSSHGLSATVKQKANEIISFSRLTFPHHLAVLILSEQLYRGFKILKGEPYHK